MKKLELEFRNEFKKQQDSFEVGRTTIKFGTMGIGFSEEEDWNTNLPYSCEADEIAKHIWKNRKYPQITKKILIEAIEVLRKASVYYKTHEEPETIERGDFNQFTQSFEALREKVGKKYS